MEEFARYTMIGVVIAVVLLTLTRLFNIPIFVY